MKFTIGDYVLIRKYELLYPAKITGETSSDFYYGKSRYTNGDIIIYFNEILTSLTETEYLMNPVNIRETFPEYFI